jgi:hypothetical protein
MELIRKAFYPVLAIVGVVLLWTVLFSANARQCIRSGGVVFRDGCNIMVKKHLVPVPAPSRFLREID